MKRPYGEASFEKIRTKGYYYIDKTRYIELLETEPKSSAFSQVRQNSVPQHARLVLRPQTQGPLCSKN